MSDIPDEIMKAAINLANQLLDRGIGDEDRYATIIARALMAADEAATKRERERCAAIASDFDWTGAQGDPRTGDVMPSAVCEDISAAILKGDA